MMPLKDTDLNVVCCYKGPYSVLSQLKKYSVFYFLAHELTKLKYVPLYR